MDTTTYNTILSGVFGFIAGFASVSLNAFLTSLGKERELEISHRYKIKEIKEELLLEHIYEKEGKSCSNNYASCGISKVRERLSRIERLVYGR